MSATSSESESAYIDQIIYQNVGQAPPGGQKPYPKASSRNLLGQEGVGPVASSLDNKDGNKDLRGWNDKLHTLAQGEGHPYSSLCYLTSHERTVLIYRAIDKSGRRSSFAHVLIGSPEVLTPRRALGSWRWTWPDARKPGAAIEPELPRIQASDFIRSADAGWKGLLGEDAGEPPGLWLLMDQLFGPHKITPDLGNHKFAIIVDESGDYYLPVLLLSRTISNLGSSAFLRDGGFSLHEPKYDESQYRLPRFVFATKPQVQPMHRRGRIVIRLDGAATGADEAVKSRVLSNIQKYKDISGQGQAKQEGAGPARDEQQARALAREGLHAGQKYGTEPSLEPTQEPDPPTSADRDQSIVTSAGAAGCGVPEGSIPPGGDACPATGPPVPAAGTAGEAPVPAAPGVAGTMPGIAATERNGLDGYAPSEGGQDGTLAARSQPFVPARPGLPPGGPVGDQSVLFERPQGSPLRPPEPWSATERPPVSAEAKDRDLNLIRRLAVAAVPEIGSLIEQFRMRIAEQSERSAQPIDRRAVQDLLIQYHFHGARLQGLKLERGPGELYDAMANFAFSNVGPDRPDPNTIVAIIGDDEVPRLLVGKILAIVWRDNRPYRTFGQVVGDQILADLGFTLPEPEPEPQPEPSPEPHPRQGISRGAWAFAGVAVVFLLIMALLALGSLS